MNRRQPETLLDVTQYTSCVSGEERVVAGQDGSLRIASAPWCNRAFWTDFATSAPINAHPAGSKCTFFGRWSEHDLSASKHTRTQCVGSTGKNTHRSDMAVMPLTVFAALVINCCVQVIHQQLGVLTSSHGGERGQSLRVVGNNFCVGSTHRCCNL